MCFVTRARTSAHRAFEDKHSKEKPSKANGYLTPTDGVTVWAATENLTPDDDFL